MEVASGGDKALIPHAADEYDDGLQMCTRVRKLGGRDSCATGRSNWRYDMTLVEVAAKEQVSYNPRRRQQIN